MQQENIILYRGETFALRTNPVESFPVKADRKLSAKQVIGDFGLRNIGDGVTRVQSWCKVCRNESNRTGVAA